jgi:putative flippase GtrA
MEYMSNIGTSAWNVFEKIMRFVVFRIFHIKVSKDKWEGFLQFVKFGIVGLSNTVISYVIYVVALLMFQRFNLLPNVDYLIAQFIGFVLSVLWSFYWNRKFVFEADDNITPWYVSLIKTYISYAFTGIFLSTLLSYIWVQCIGIPKMIAPIFNLIISVPLNFVLNKFWAFKK